MTKDQLKHLRERVINAQRYAKAATPDQHDRFGRTTQLNEYEIKLAPADVRAANETLKKAMAAIESWRKKQRQTYEDQIRAIDAAAQQAEAVILFHDPTKALKAVEAFEKKYGPKQ